MTVHLHMNVNQLGNIFDRNLSRRLIVLPLKLKEFFSSTDLKANDEVGLMSLTGSFDPTVEAKYPELTILKEEFSFLIRQYPDITRVKDVQLVYFRQRFQRLGKCGAAFATSSYFSS